MRSLLFAATILSVALCPATPLHAEQAMPVVSTPLTLVSPADPAATSPAAGSAAPGGLTRLTVKDGDGTLRTMLCQPVSVEKAAPQRAASSPVTRALPASPAPRRATVPAARPCPPPPRATDMNIAPNVPLYADPAAVAAAWECYVPRQMAYAPREWRAPDPAVHSPLPPLRSTIRRSTRTPAKAPAKLPDPVCVDVLVSVVQALCPPAAVPAAAAARSIYGGPAPSVSGGPAGTLTTPAPESRR